MMKFQNPTDNTGYMPLKRHITLTVNGKILEKLKYYDCMTENKPKLLYQVRQVIRIKHYNLRTEKILHQLDKKVYLFP